MTKERTTFPTQAAFARALGVSGPTMSRYVRRDDWPVTRAPPWTAANLATVQRWRGELQEDRARDNREPSVAELAEIRAMIEQTTGLTYAQWLAS
ncbi:MAG: hypothetical protein ACREJC_14565 [Tepidisphaeraceae bacterium]